jgi:hypothetical protein
MEGMPFLTYVSQRHIVYSEFVEIAVKPRRPTYLKALPLFEDVAQAEIFHLQVLIHAVA